MKKNNILSKILTSFILIFLLINIINCLNASGQNNYKQNLEYLPENNQIFEEKNPKIENSISQLIESYNENIKQIGIRNYIKDLETKQEKERFEIFLKNENKINNQGG